MAKLVDDIEDRLYKCSAIIFDVSFRLFWDLLISESITRNFGATYGLGRVIKFDLSKDEKQPLNF